MTSGRLIIGLITAVVVESFGFFLPGLKPQAFWVPWVDMMRLVILGAMVSGLAVTGGQPAIIEAKPKMLKSRGAPPEKDEALEAMAAAFKEKLEPPKPVAEPVINREKPVDFVKLQDEANPEEEENHSIH